jgi:MATE family multidrug resistance protein
VLLAATAVVKQVVTLAAFFIDGFAFATESLAGILDGEGDRRGLRRLLGMALGLSLVTGLLFALVFNLFGRPLFHLFTDHAEVLTEILRYAPWLFGVLATGSVAYALDGYFIGLVQGRILSRAMLLAAVVGFAPAGVWAWHVQSADALWAALSIFMLARTLTLAVKVPETLRGA